nr:hypothetical protein [Tanacetum cinerariifolium]
LAVHLLDGNAIAATWIKGFCQVGFRARAHVVLGRRCRSDFKWPLLQYFDQLERKEPISPVFRSNLFSLGSIYVLASALAQLFLGSGFNHSDLSLTLGRWAVPVSFESEKCTSLGVGTSSIGYSNWGAVFCLEDPEIAPLVSDVFQAEDV